MGLFYHQRSSPNDYKVIKTFENLIETQCNDGGWRCKKFSFGRGTETEFSNPLPTLNALNAIRYGDYPKNEIFINNAVEFLLNHWIIKKPIGPCHYGIGSLFMSLEYPFRNYNLFNYVYILSFFDYAKDDKRFLEAFKALESKAANGKIIVERVVPKLSKLSFCRKGKPSELATIKYNEILKNLGK